MNNIIQTIERVTPTIAKSYLYSSLGNRPISQSVVKSYATTMKNGGWKVNGVPIVFDKNGHLLDGHHRLHAIIFADRCVELSITRGVDSDTFTTFDCGRTRNASQIFAMAGVANYNKISGIVSASMALKRYGTLKKNNGVKDIKATNDSYYQEYKSDPESYNEISRFSENCYKIAHIMRISWIGGLTYYLTHTGTFELNYVKKFFSAVCNLDTSGISAADELRKLILRNDRVNNKRLDDSYLFAIVIKAWNAYTLGKTVGQLRFNSETEEYPKLRLKPII